MNYKRPDYQTARQNAGFNWFIETGYSPLMKLTNISMKSYCLQADACVEMIKKGWPKFREIYGDLVPYPGISTPQIGYGHVNCLGSELIFPENGEPFRTNLYSSLDEGIAALQKPVDFRNAGMMPFYLDYWEKVKKAFPGENIGFGFSVQGPVTTAWFLRGEKIFEEIFDRPQEYKTFLKLVTQSVISYHHFIASLSGNPPINPNGSGLCDDIASMIPPRMWPAFVLPFFEQYYQGKTTGVRGAHIEDLKPDHLKYLEDIGLNRYDPSISPKLNPIIISQHCRVPFAWRLVNFHYSDMNCQDVQDWVFKAAADGATTVFTSVEDDMLDSESVKKVQTFAAAAAEAEKILKSGASRKDLLKNVSANGLKKFWDKWPNK